MSKVSKNLKKFRTEKGLTQETLADKIFVTRQAISNWETGKTKPDIDSLLKLAEVLDVQVEELIYGERKEKIAVVDKSKEKNRIKIILAIVGSVFLGVGLVFIFFEFWKHFSIVIQTIFGILPALAGQLIAVFIVLKKKTNVAWRESASILWTVGTVATVALLNEIFSINCGYINCMAIDVILIAPIMFVLNAVSPLAFYYYMTVHISTEGRGEYLLFGLIFFLVGVVFNIFMTRKKEDTRGIFTQWITVIASIPILIVLTAVLEEKGFVDEWRTVVFLVLFVYFICMYILSAKVTTFTLPYKPLSILGMCVSMFIIPFILTLGLESVEVFVTIFLLSILLPIACLLFNRKNIPKSPIEMTFMILPIVYIAVVGVLFAINVYSNTYKYDYTNDYFILSTFIFIFGGILALLGTKQLKLFHINVGLLLIFAQIISLFVNFFDESYIAFGVMFVLFGVAIFAVNGKMLAVKKQNKIADGGVTDVQE